MAQMTGDDSKVVVFKIESEEYATGISQVERILEYEKITRIPDCPDYLEGIINYQGRIIPVLDLKKRFNLSGTRVSEDSKIIIAREDQGDIGLIIDSVSEVIDIPDGVVSAPPDVIAGIIKKYIKGVIKLEGRIIIYLNLLRILKFDEREVIDELIS